MQKYLIQYVMLRKLGKPKLLRLPPNPTLWL